MSCPTADIPLGELQPEQGIDDKRAAVILGVSAPIVRRLRKDGKLPFYRVGNVPRIRLGDVFAFQRHWRTADYDMAIKDLVDAAPKLSPAQRDLIAAAFGGADAP